VILRLLEALASRLLAWRDARRAREGRFIVAPELDTADAVAGWLFDRGAKRVSCWSTPDGKVRGVGMVR